jgi:hypothetical protein
VDESSFVNGWRSTFREMVNDWLFRSAAATAATAATIFARTFSANARAVFGIRIKLLNISSAAIKMKSMPNILFCWVEYMVRADAIKMNKLLL